MIKQMRAIKWLLVIGLAGSLLAACSTPTDPTEKFKNKTAEQIYQGGEVALAKGRESTAIEHFEALDALYPFGANAEQAQLDLMYAYYQSGDNASASATAERFIRLYPRSVHADYAYYIKGLADFDQDRGWFQRYLPTDLSQRDPGTMSQAFDDFNALLKIYPDSVYAPDARQRMIYLRNLFAEHNLHIAQYYFRRAAYVAAANRANYVVQHFDGTPQVEDALGIMVRSYRKLGLQVPEQQALSVLQLNYPNGSVLKNLNKPLSFKSRQ